MSLQKFLSNLWPRLQLLRIALTRRFIYEDLATMMRDYGMDYHDLRAELHSLEILPDCGDESCRTFRELLLHIPESITFTPPGAPALFHSEPSVARFLAEWVYRKKATSVIELGCFTGWTSAHLARALAQNGPEGVLYTVDPCSEYLESLKENLERCNLFHNVKPLQGFSMDPSVMAALPAKADLIFLDTSHSYPETRDEVLAYLPRLTAGGCMALHDSISAPGVRKSLLELGDYCDRHTFATELGNGLTLLFPKSRKAPQI